MEESVMTVAEAKLFIEAYLETNRLIMKSFDTQRAFEFSKSDEYWEEVIRKFEQKKFLKAKL